MGFLAYLLLLAALLGLGTLTASILPTRGARVGLGVVAFLAVIVDATWFTAPLTGWSAGLADAVWILAFGALVLIAAIIAGYYRGTTGQSPWLWPTARDLTFLIVVMAVFGAVMLVLPVPLDTDAQGFGYLALTLREGHDYTTLAPWHPEIEYLYSPGYIGLIAHFSARFDLGIHTLELALSAALAMLFVWLAYDLGGEMGGARAARSFMLAAVIGTGLITAYMDSHFTALLALTFALACVTFVIGFLRARSWVSAVFAAICLAGVPLSQPDITIALIIGYAPWLIVIWFAKPRPGLRAWLTLAVVIPLLALVLVAPWLLSIQDLLRSDIESPFAVESAHWREMTIMHGGVIVALAVIGALASARRRHPAILLALVWLVGIVEFSTLGVLQDSLPDAIAPLLKYDYPFSLAWHGPIIPYTILGGTGLLWLANRLGGKGQRVDRWLSRLAVPFLVLALAGLVAGVVSFDSILETSKDHAHFFGAFSSSADVDVMRWLRDNTPEDARVLNHPGPHEGDWAPVIAERDTVYFRPQPFFRDTAPSDAEQAALRAFWRDPADPSSAKALDAAGVRYVLVPQVFGDPDSFEAMARWRGPLPEAAGYLQTPLGDAPYLRLIYERDGAQVYEVIPPEKR